MHASSSRVSTLQRNCDRGLELVEDRFPRLSHLWLDAGYNGKGKGKDWAEKALGLRVEVVRPPRRWVWVREDQEPPPCPGFTVLPRRWVVERTFSWIDQNRLVGARTTRS
jgi:putative transposase